MFDRGVAGGGRWVLQDSESQGVKAALTFGLCCGHAWSDYAGEIVVVWSWWWLLLLTIAGVL
jgi:hypothetical protein